MDTMDRCGEILASELSLHCYFEDKFGDEAYPETWWPVYHGVTDPPVYERAITNILVQRSKWASVRPNLDRLADAGLLTAQALAESPTEAITRCIQTSGLAQQKTKTLQALAQATLAFGGERPFVEKATREDFLAIKGIGEPTADRMMLFVCDRLAWPVDEYCLRVWTHYRMLRRYPRTPRERREASHRIKEGVQASILETAESYQVFHAGVQLEGSTLPKPKLQ